jgi:hypothetical protein
VDFLNDEFFSLENQSKLRMLLKNQWHDTDNFILLRSTA